MPFSIATWNINSVRLRMPIVERLLVEQAPDVLCLQETKVPDELFPEKAFRKLGYEHIAFHGQKGYHGVATVARRPIEVVEKRRFCEIEDSRHLSVTVQAGGKIILVHNFYVPAGGDEPDPVINRKFKHKLDFVAEMNAIRAEHDEVSEPAPAPCIAFASTPRGYRLVELEDGHVPDVGEQVQLAEVGELVVLRRGPSPLPMDERICVYLEPLVPAGA